VKDKVLITGFNGALAKRLDKILDKNRYELNYLTTKKNLCCKHIFYWNIHDSYIDKNALLNTKHIIHLSGFNISNAWTKKNKKIMFDSRVKASKLIYTECLTLKIKVQTFITASAMGYYGFNQSGVKKEDDQAGSDWMSELCIQWESIANKFKSMGTRISKLRFALILDKKSEIIQKTNIGFKFGFGLIFGSGKQQFEWIHIEDACRFIKLIIENNDTQGVFNVASPQSISHYDFIKTFQSIKYPKSFLLYIPKIIIQCLMPKKNVLLFNDMELCVKRMRNLGFEWKYETIDKVIREEF